MQIATEPHPHPSGRIRGRARRTLTPLASFAAAQLANYDGPGQVAILEAPLARHGGAVSRMRDYGTTQHFIDLRAAAAHDDRERRLKHLLNELHGALNAGRTVELTWPLDRDAAAATSFLGAPLALMVAGCVHSTDGALVIHTRSGAPGDFLTSPPTDRISFVFHLNCEEAAMRWERADAEPGKRLAAAARLRAAGWTVWACVGPVRLFSGWRDEYGDLAGRAAAAGVQRLLVSFPGEDALELGDPDDTECLDVVEALDGLAFTVSEKHRRDIYTFLQGCMHTAS
ncbi:MAG: hypothetical protein ACR2IE_09900 [Candidatus Sumerlaeaceae bacterium]